MSDETKSPTPKCEGCGRYNSHHGYQGINLMNGHLWLCKLCLSPLRYRNIRQCRARLPLSRHSSL